jgi:hypothetical protein
MSRTLAKIEAQKRYRAKNYQKHKYLTKKINEIYSEEITFRMFRKMFK